MRTVHTISLNEVDEGRLKASGLGVMKVFRLGLDRTKPQKEKDNSVSTLSEKTAPAKFGISEIAQEHAKVVLHETGQISEVGRGVATTSEGKPVTTAPLRFEYGCGCVKQDGLSLCSKHGRI